jgi:hypothetical protein
MLGGRSQRELWINQAQLFGEVHRLVLRKEAQHCLQDGRGWSRDRGYGFLRDVLRGARSAFGDAWGDNKRYMITRDVTLKALVRVAGDVAAAWGKRPPPAGEMAAWLGERLKRWSELSREFRREGFYERFPARGQVERVEKIRKRLGREVGLGD